MLIEFDNITLKTSKSVYTPQEDTYFFEDCILDFFSTLSLQNKIDAICEMGCGTGYLSIQLAKMFPNSYFHVLDINEFAVDLTKLNFKLNILKNSNNLFLQSDLFSSFKNKNIPKYDLIIFNPPYIPSNEKNSNFGIFLSWNGGEKGLNIINRFLASAQDYIKSQGYIFLLLTSYNLKFDEIKTFIGKKSKNLKIIKEYKKKINLETLFLIILQKQNKSIQKYKILNI